ncbi:hypothetical protein RRF57_012463 [Xylaria bambusicola]|uniref:Uncharacterized protein n=1 Tax=Xylaria bambusicola TaxID=326684 RepID=A0AAN7V1S3_9PEZI
MWAARGGHALIVSILVKHSSVGISRRNRAGRTGVSWAAGDGMEDILKDLLKVRGVDANPVLGSG